MVYRGVEYTKVRGFWRAKPGHGDGTRAAARRRHARKKVHTEPATFWECVNERTGRSCGVHHRGRGGAAAHVRQLDRKTYRTGGGRQAWEPFQVVDGQGYHYGVGAPKR